MLLLRRWRINEPPSNTWIKTTKDGEVNCAHCDCMAELDEVCSHVGAILFYVEAVRRNKSYMDVPCSWSMPSSVDKIKFRMQELQILILWH